MPKHKPGLPPDLKKSAGTRARRQSQRPVRKIPAILKFAGLAVVVGLLGYCVSETSGVAYGESDIRVVDFSSLNPSQKRSALRQANGERCTCGCGMTLAECVSTDSTCPLREPNIQQIKTMVQNAGRR